MQSLKKTEIFIGYSSHFMLTVDRRCFREITQIIEKEIKNEQKKFVC